MVHLSRAFIASAIISSACGLDLPFRQEEFECTQGGNCPFQLMIDAPFPSSTYTTHAVEIEVNGEVIQTCQSPTGAPSTAHTCTLKLPQRTQVLLRPSSPGWFLGWSEGCEGQMECELSITHPLERTARFAPKGKLEIEVLGDGRVASSDGQMLCEGDCSFPFEVGARTTLTTEDNNGVFGTWCGDCSGDQDCTLTQSISETQSFQRKVQARFSTGVEIGVTSPCEEENVLFLDGISNTCEGAALVPFAGTAQGARISEPTTVADAQTQSIWMTAPSPSPEHPGEFTVLLQHPDAEEGLVAGRYLQATGIENRLPGAPVMHIRQNGESTCTNLSGRFEIKSIEYSQDSIRAMLVTFSQTCELTGEVISGCINYAAP